MSIQPASAQDSGSLMDLNDLELKLSRCRTQINSKLDNQKNLALILSAVEENIESLGNKKTPVAYFVSFIALLDQAISQDAVVEEKLASAAAYFLDLTLPFTAKSLLRQEFAAILTKLAPILTSADAEALLVRSSIGALEGLLIAQDSQQWLNTTNVSPKRALLGMIELSFDPRPKVRKRAQEAILKILCSPPASPSPIHPAAPLCAELARKKLESLLLSSNKKKSQKNKEQNSTMIHTLQLITAITSANSWPANQVEALCDVLLLASRTSDQYIIASAFGAFDGLFSSMAHDIDVEKFASILSIIVDLKPSNNDTHLAVAWLAVIANGYLTFAKLLAESALAKIPQVLPLVSEFIASESSDIYVSAAQSFIAILCEGIQDSLLHNQTPEASEQVDDVITFVAELIEKELFSIKYQHSISVLLDIATAAVTKFGSRANPDFLNILQVVGNWRTDEEFNFPHNKRAEELIAASIRAMGPEVVLSTLPLNLTETSKEKPGRAWLLPIVRDNVRVASLRYYQNEILPIASKFEEIVSSSEDPESMQCKVFGTIIDQVWSLLPGFCDLPIDLSSAFSDEFATYLAEKLYKEVGLRSVICKALRTLVESNMSFCEGTYGEDAFISEVVTAQTARENIQYLASKSSNMLSVLFNVFSSTMPDSRGFVLETIDTFLRIVPSDDLEVSFNKVCALLKDAIDLENGKDAQKNKNKNNTPALSSTMMDLVVAMAKYVPESSFNALFSILSTAIYMLDHPLMQKRSYRIITKLSETDSGKNAITRYNKELQNVILQTADHTNPSCRAARLGALQEIIATLPSTELAFIPSILQEIIMSTKDVNEKSRELAYSLLIQMGKTMQNGGTIVTEGTVEAGPTTSEASLTEYFTMVSAGLAAQSPHMISAAITALSCIVFEFKDDLQQELLMEIVSTVELFLTHNSREIAKSAIGFVKVEILALPHDLVKNNLPELLTKLMRWSHEHKGHFKTKVKHIIERLIRKFGIEDVENAIPEEDKKLVANIKKSKLRAKRKEAAAPEAERAKSDPKFMSAFEEALYDSESEDEGPAPQSKESDKFILTSGDDPLDLLDRQTLAHISSSKPKKFGKKNVKEHEFATKNGKFVFKEAENSVDKLESTESGIDAYLDAVKQAPVRGQKNKLKFKKSKEDDWSDTEDSVPTPTAKTFKPSNAKVTKPKQRFKARKKL